MKLYHSPGTCALAVHIALREARLPFSLERVDIKAHRTESGEDYCAINPKGGYVPLLETDDGQRLTEVPNLLTFVADQAPARGLAPPVGSFERYRMAEWLAFISSELHKTFSPLFNSTLPAAVKLIFKDKARTRLGYVAGALGEKPYLMGGELGVADPYLLVMLRWARNFEIDLEAHPGLVAYRQRMEGRPAVREALQAEGAD